MFILLIISILLFINNNYGFKINLKNNNYYRLKINLQNNKYCDNNYYENRDINKEEFIINLNNNKIKLLIAIGSTESTNTLLAYQKAIIELKNNNIDKIIITRPTKSIENEEIEFFPAMINKKIEYALKPIFNIFEEFYYFNEINLLIKNNKIEICPLLFMQGRTFKNCIIIADKMQNSDPILINSLISGIGTNSKLIITGDLKQSKLKTLNGLSDFIDKYDKQKNKCSKIKIINFSNDDDEISQLENNMINIYDCQNTQTHIKITNISCSISNLLNTTNNTSLNITKKIKNYNDCAL